MALRIANKINRQFVKNVCRSLSTKRDITDLEITSRNNDDASGETGPLSNSTNSPSNPVQYQVCQPRAANRSAPTLTVNFSAQRNTVQNETEVAKNAMAMQHLQPALLPEYYKPPVEINSSIYQDPTNEAEKQTSLKKATRKFEESSTRLNLCRPLKAPKLANPFPEPVKVMPSHTVCDKEKAELMLAEQKMAAKTVILSPPPPQMHHHAASTSRQHSQQHQQQQQEHHHPMAVLAKCQRRQYSTKSSKRKCNNPKVLAACPDKAENKCMRRFRMPCCPPVRVGGCSARKISRTPCVKTMSPYPAYSEACVSFPYRKPSECRMCPWKKNKHPTFRDQKKFHTESDYVTSVAQSSGIDKNSKRMTRNEEFVDSINADIINGNDVGYKIHSSIGCLEEKPPCKQPKGHCEDTRPKDAAEQRERNKLKKDECVKKPPGGKGKCANSISLGDQIGAWLQQTSKKTPMMDSIEANNALSIKLNALLQNPSISIDENLILLKDKPCPPSPCKKFPFKHENFELVKEREPAPRHNTPGHCPEKKHKLIKDCPAGPCGCYKNAPTSHCLRHRQAEAGVGTGGGMAPPTAGGSNGGGAGYLMSSDDCGPPKKPPCKKFEKPKCKEEEPEYEECDRGLHPRSAICPKDAGFELHYKRPKFIPKTQEEIDRDRENKKHKKTKSLDEELPLILPPAQTQIYPYMNITIP